MALSDMLHVSFIRVNLISIALLGKVGVKMSFEYDKIVMTKNNVSWGRDIVIKVSLYLMFQKLLMNLLLLILLTRMIYDMLN